MKKMKLLAAALAVCALLAGCTPKLATVRPAEVSLMRVTRLADGATAELPSQSLSADLKDELIFQLEEPYEKTGECADSDAHTYRVELYIGDKLDTDVTINADGSVCRGGARYVAAAKADKPVDIASWEALFGGVSAETSEPVEAEPAVIGGVEFAAQGQARPFNEKIDDETSAVCADVLPWSYYISEAADGSRAYVWRDTPEGSAELLLSAPQSAGEGAPAAISFEGGAEQSAGKYLYFTLCDAATCHRCLLVLNTESLYFNEMYPAPCSNMAIPESAPADFEGLGWIIYENYLVPVELEKAEEYTGGIIDLAGYYDALDEELFYGLGDFGTHKYVRLASAGGSKLTIESVTAEPGSGAEERVSAHEVDFAAKSFN